MQPECMTVDAAQSDTTTLMRALRDRIGDKNYRAWFDGRSRLRVDADALSVCVSGPFEQNWIQRHFGSHLQSLACEFLGPAARTEIRTDEQFGAPVAESAIAGRIDPPALIRRKPVVAAERVTRKSENPSLPNATRHTFGDFVVGPENELAFLAARRAAESIEDAHHGPLYLHGGIGIGKTHLLEAIAQAVRRRATSKNVLRLTAETFANYFTKALRERSLPAFRHKMRAADVLLVDDVNFLDGKKVIQEEFLHTLKQLEERGRLMVFTADRHPRLLLKTREELTSRLGAGMICRLEVPGQETRLKIVEQKARRMSAVPPREVLEYLSRRFSRTVRELEGALNCLEHIAELSGRTPTLSVARKALAELERDCVRMIQLSDIERCVCQFFGLQPHELKSGAKTQNVSHPRMLAMYLARKLTPSSYNAIGTYFGGRRHNTVVSAEQTVQKWLDSNVAPRIASRNVTLSEVLGTLERELMAV